MAEAIRRRPHDGSAAVLGAGLPCGPGFMSLGGLVASLAAIGCVARAPGQPETLLHLVLKFKNIINYTTLVLLVKLKLF